jgi:hypothetical protein
MHAAGRKDKDLDLDGSLEGKLAGVAPLRCAALRRAAFCTLGELRRERCP